MNEPASQVASKPADYVTGLDGLRGWAVIGVMLFHLQVNYYGWAGVQAFFVLSGFLITRILLRQTDAPLSRYLRNFYGRRSLRILPIYYAYLLLLLLATTLSATPPNVAPQLLYAFTYTYDFFHASEAYSHSRYLTHFWTLAVEEQFYLVWPLVLYLVSRATLKKLLIVMVLAGPAIRYITYQLAQDAPGLYSRTAAVVNVLPTSHMDAFAIGALLSLVTIRRPRLLFFAALVITFGCGYLHQQTLLYGPGFNWLDLGYPLFLPYGNQFVWGYSLINITSALLIACLLERPFLPWLFNNRVIVYIGSISYGMYVLHFPVLAVLAGWVSSRGMAVALNFAVTMALASLSFYLFERPLMRLKNRWFNDRANTASPASQAE